MADTVVVSSDLSVRRLSKGIWLHVTSSDPTPSYEENGLFLETGQGVLMVDTGSGEAMTRRLLAWTQDRLQKPVTHVILTHAPRNDADSIRYLLAQGIPVSAHQTTARLLANRGVSGLRTFQNVQALRLDSQTQVEMFFPGPGHSEDNIVVWLPKERILFGGRLVKAQASKALENDNEADVLAWKASLGRVTAKFTRAWVVVPGVGQWGGRELLEHTKRLVAGFAGFKEGGGGE